MYFYYKKKECFINKIISIVLIISVIALIPVCVYPTTLRERFTDHGNVPIYLDDILDDQPTYLKLLNSYKEKSYINAETEVLPVSIKPTMPNGTEAMMEEGVFGATVSVFKWENNEEWAQWEFFVEKAGLYEIEVEYHLNIRGDEAVRVLEINGEVPFTEANRITFLGAWRDETDEVSYNSIGDEIRPRQIPIPGYKKVKIKDSTGFYPEPIRIYFDEGLHELRMLHITAPIYISDIRLVPPVDIKSYEEVQAEYEANNYVEATQTLKIQAERPVYEKSHPTLRRETNSDPTCEPRSLRYQRFNIIGDWMWRNGNQSITWKINAPESGLYKIGIRALQHWGSGLPVYRQIAINGKVPFKEMLEYRIPFNRKWNLEILENENNEPFLFYLDEGENTLTITAKTGEFTEIIHSVSDDGLILSDLLLNITMITGSNPDPNYDYDLDKKIPDLIDTLKYLQDSMRYKVELINEITETRPAIINSFMQIIIDLQSMIDSPDRIPRQLRDLHSYQSNLSTWYLSFQDQPLAIDYFLYGNPQATWVNERANIFQIIGGVFENLFYSFIKDYDNIADFADIGDDKEVVIDVWVGRGQEWAETLKRLAEDEFTPNKGIRLRMNVLPATQLNVGGVNALMLAITAGNAPDVALTVSTITPVEFAIRDGVINLARFDDFEEFSKNFLPGILIPFEYRGGVYGLPETMEFRALFYRTDILEKIGIGLPDTWDDVYNFVLPVLYQNNLQMFIPNDYTTFLYQHGGSYYTDDGMQSALDTPEAFRAFRQHTEVYTHYGVPIFADFYNRMRTGEMPIGITGFQDYIRIMVSAPELTGRWSIAPVPGIEQPDGTINRSVSGIAVDASIILSQSENQDESWEFLKWWLSTDTQVIYARDIESIVGSTARWNTANINAYDMLPWDNRDLEIIRNQWEWAKDIPNVLGGYFTGRHINNAWNRVVLGGMNPRDSLELAVESINMEMEIRQEQYGYR